MKSVSEDGLETVIGIETRAMWKICYKKIQAARFIL